MKRVRSLKSLTGILDKVPMNHPRIAQSDTEAPKVAEVKTEAEAPQVAEVKIEAEAPQVAEVKIEAEAPQVAEVKTEAEAPQVAEVKTEAEAPQVAEVKTEAEAPQETEVKTEAEAPQETEVKTEAEAPQETEADKPKETEGKDAEVKPETDANATTIKPYRFSLQFSSEHKERAKILAAQIGAPVEHLIKLALADLNVLPTDFEASKFAKRPSGNRLYIQLDSAAAESYIKRNDPLSIGRPIETLRPVALSAFDRAAELMLSKLEAKAKLEAQAKQDKSKKEK